MKISEFIESLEGSTEPPPSAALAKLSGLTTEEAAELADEWASWPPGRLRQLLRQLVELHHEDAALEFEEAFKLAMWSADSDARLLAVNGLSSSGDRTLIGRLIELLQHDDHLPVRVASAEAMAYFCALACDGRLHDRDAQRMREALLDVAASQSEPPAVRRSTLEAVSVFEGHDVAALIEAAYREGDEEMRCSALHAMGRNGDPRWLSTVIGELDSPAGDVRCEAATAVGALGQEEHAKELEPALDDQDLAVHMAAVAALVEIGGDEARRLLAGAAQSPEPDVADAAAGGLQALEDEEGLIEAIPESLARRAGSLWGGPVSADTSVDEDFETEDEEGGELEESADRGDPFEDENTATGGWRAPQLNRHNGQAKAGWDEEEDETG